MHARHPLAVALLALGLALPRAALADEAALQKRIDALEAQLRALQDQLTAIRADAKSAQASAANAQATAEKAVAAAPQAAASGTAAVAAGNAAPPASMAPYAFPQIGPNTVLSSYGEIQYNVPQNSNDALADVGRFVIGIAHSFTDRTRMAAEFEVEHAVTSADDSGEAEVEQAYVEHDFTDHASGKAGLFLIPVGLLNEHHEPTVYYGVYRNHVETAIIPTTWREIGVGGTWHDDTGWTVNAGLTTGFNLSKWDPNSDEGRESPLGSIHQEGQLAAAKNLSGYAGFNWRGVPGLEAGATVFYGGAGQGVDFAGKDAKVTLYEGHVRWTPGPWDLAALYAHGAISDIGDLNATFAGAPTPVPATFDGWYTQAAYKFTFGGGQQLGPFIRYEQYNTARSYVGLPVGFDVPTGPNNKATTLGLNYWLTPGVVFKLDYQWLRPDDTQSRFALGIGYAF
ncbi:MAG: hypothetical protein JSR18_00935 [Proteobacteria bacterium]|nr:hypothetical protein [Pseudomonadota bacterium]